MNGSTSDGEAVLTAPLALRAGVRSADEGELVRQAQRGSRDAVEAIVRRHWHEAHRAAFLIVRDEAAAEDIAQESMLAAIREIERFDSRRPIAPWLHRIVANRSIDWLRAGNRDAAATELLHSPSEASVDPRTLPADLAEAMGRLPADDRAIVVLRHLLDLSSDEIGALLSMPAATVRTRLRRALSVLRADLKPETRS